MTEQQPDPERLAATTVTDTLIERTGNGKRHDDPADQPPQDPGWLPDGTETGDQ